MTPDSTRLLYLLIVLVISGPSLFYALRHKDGLRNAAIWICLIAILVVGRSYYQAAQREEAIEYGGYEVPS